METRSPVLTAPAPAHWSLRQRLKNAAIYALVRLALTFVARLPFAIVSAFTWVLGALAPLVAAWERRRAEAHLSFAFPELTHPERRRVVRRMFHHLARSVAEVVQIERFLEGPHAVRLAAEHRRLLDEVFAEGRGVVAVTGHIGNWELLAQVVARSGYPITAIAKPLYDPRLTRLVHAARTRYGMQVVWRGDSGASRDMLAVFKSRGMLALLIDQDTKVQGAFVPFFGRPAFTPTAAAALALRFGAPVVVVWHHRVGSEHRLHFERLPFAPSDDKEADVVRFTAAMTARLEAAIRAHPEQWVWMHRRWRRTPPQDGA